MNLRFILVKTLRGLLTLLLVVTFAFFSLRASGDPVEIMLGADAEPDVIAHYQKLYGLDKPWLEQYWGYLQGITRGDLGVSLADGRDVTEVIMEAVPATLELGFAGLALGLVIGVPLGIWAALKRGQMADRFAMGFAVFGFSVPNFFLGIVLILIFSLWLRWLPSSGSETWQHLVMPTLALGTASAGALARFTRSAMLEVLSKAYVRTAAAKGVPPWRRVTWHALPNALIPLVTVLGFRLGDLVAGAVVVETVFAWPGIGRMLVGAVAQRDLALVQGILLIVAATMVLANLMVDVIYGWVDPRIRSAEGGSGSGS